MAYYKNMENKHKAAGKESVTIRNQKKNALQSKQKGPKIIPMAPKKRKSK
jgi:hypothetical protein